MKAISRHYCWIFALFFICIGCATPGEQAAPNQKGFKLLSKPEAAAAIVVDEKEQYFDKVTNLEMSIQLRMESPAAERNALLADYKKFIQDDIEPFDANEKKLVQRIMAEALDLCKKIRPDLNLPEIHLIKTKGGYYGPSVYFTRDNLIIIPAPQIKDNASFKRTMIHEIFHVYSRYNKDKRDELYAAIGYKKLKSLELSDFLKERVLYNPDGVDIAYGIEIQDSSGRTLTAIPAIFSKYSSYRLQPLMQSMLFQLFEVEEQEDGSWKVIAEDIGLKESEIGNYWEQIGKNTRYTIHPDEVLAENFTFLALSKISGSVLLEDFSSEGQALIKKIESIIQN